MEDYPEDLLDFEARFSSNAACRAYLFLLRGNELFQTSFKKHDQAWSCRPVRPSSDAVSGIVSRLGNESQSNRADQM